MAKYINWSSYKKYFKLMSNKDLANLIGCSSEDVEQYKNSLKVKVKPIIKPVDIKNNTNNKFVPIINWDKWDNLLGTDIDKNIAKLVGCSKTTIAKRRKKLGIKAFKRS